MFKFIIQLEDLDLTSSSVSARVPQLFRPVQLAVLLLVVALVQ